ncbi:MAG: hypothetical protein ACRDOI_24600 [Trebonia sp.]
MRLSAVPTRQTKCAYRGLAGEAEGLRGDLGVVVWVGASRALGSKDCAVRAVSRTMVARNIFGLLV